MLDPKKPISLRLGSLAEPLAEWCDKHSTTPSEASRIAIAAMLGVDAPEMPVGNPSIAEQAAAANQARWTPKRKSQKSS
jgi:hypothetical protein